MQSEDDCDGHETTRYTLCIGDKEVGNMTADMLGLSFFSKRGDVAVVTMTVLALNIILIMVQSHCDAKQHCRVHLKLLLYISGRANDFVSFYSFSNWYYVVSIRHKGAKY